MAVNLIELAKGYLTDAVVDKASSFLGESNAATQTGINNVLPALMGGMLSKANSREGANDLFKMVSRPEMDGSLLNNIGDLFGGGDTTNKTMDLGGSLLNGLMGKNAGGLIDLVSSASGMKSGSSSGLVKMLLPLLLSVVGKQVAGKGIGGMLDLLGGQKDHLEQAAPKGLLEKLATALGLGSIGSLFGGISNVASNFAKDIGNTGERAVEKVVDTGEDVVDAVGHGAKKVGHAAVDTAEAGGSMLRKILPWILLVLGALLLLYFLRGCGEGKGVKDAAGDAIEDTTGLVKNAGSAVVDFTADGFDAVGQLAKDGIEVVADAGGAVYNAGADLVGKAVAGFEHLGKFITRKVGDVELIIPEWGVENRLINFLDKCKVSNDKTKGWLNFDRIIFDQGSSNLDAQSMNQIENIAAILKANPNAHIKIGGYTSSEGADATNLKLSQERAEAVMAAVVVKGIDANRLTAEGYGEAHPVASNDTESGREKNRRIAVRVTKCK